MPENLSPIQVSDAWKRLIQFVQKEVPYGEIKIKIVNSNPTTLVEHKRDVRFDRPASVPSQLTVE